MDEDLYIDEYGYDYGDYYDDYTIEYGVGGYGGGDFFYGYGPYFGTGAEYGDSGYTPGGGLIDYASYEQSWDLDPPTYEPVPDSPFGGDNYYGDYLNYWLDQGLDFMTASELAAQDVQDVAGESIQIPTYEQGALPSAALSPFVMTPFFDPWAWVQPYTPIFPDLPPPVPPQQPLPLSPASSQPNLPPACPGGQYHPYPIGHPEQNKCALFPSVSTPKPPQQRPSGAQQPSGSGGSSTPKPPQQPKPPAQQQCPTGYYRDPATGQCRPIPQGQPQQCPTGYYRASSGQCLSIPKCTTPGTVFDQATGLCVPQGQAVSPLPEGVEGLFDELKNLPWWVWLALGGLLLLGKDDNGKTTTVRYRRAS
jgi:hypothetical protein